MKLLIVGGVAGGATAAARARRLNEFAEIILFERGEYISFANCGLPYYIGKVIRERDTLLVTTAEEFTNRYQIDVRPFSEVTQIDVQQKTVSVKNLTSGEVYVESYDKLILSPGAEPFMPSIEGIDLPNIFSLRNLSDTDRIKSCIDTIKPDAALIVGGGFIGLEMAENLADLGIDVTIIEMLDQVMPTLDLEMANIVLEQLVDNRIACSLENKVIAFKQIGDRLKVETAKGIDIDCDMVIMSAGIKPESWLAESAGLQLGQKGGIVVDASMKTSNPNIYAVGDAVEVKDYISGRPAMIPLAGPANKQGRIAADNVMGGKSVFKGTLGTSILKLFDLSVATTGANERFLEENNIPCMVCYTHSYSHAEYYPGAARMAMKLIFAPGSGRVLGVQIIGETGIDKRIDVLATAIKAGMSVYDLEELELAYAPPYSSAKDPVNTAGFVASNILKGDVETFCWKNSEQINPETDTLIDVRNPEEITLYGAMEGALRIPIDELRSNLPTLDKSRNYILSCAIGQRCYIGYRIMIQHGFKVKSVSGGFETMIRMGLNPN